MVVCRYYSCLSWCERCTNVGHQPCLLFCRTQINYLHCTFINQKMTFEWSYLFGYLYYIFFSLFTSVSYFSENIQTKEILFDRRQGDPLFIYSTFVEITIKRIIFFWCIVQESIETYYFQFFLVQKFYNFL